MPQDSPRRNSRRLSAAGFEFAAIILVLLGGGYLLDRRLGTVPAFMIWGGAGGFALALYRLVKQARGARCRDRRGGGEDGSEQ